MTIQSSEPLVIYSAQWCSDCQALKKWLDTQNITYTVNDIVLNSESRRTLREAIGKEAVPHIYYKDKWIRGYQIGQVFDPEWAQKLFHELGILKEA